MARTEPHTLARAARLRVVVCVLIAFGIATAVAQAFVTTTMSAYITVPASLLGPIACLYAFRRAVYGERLAWAFIAGGMSSNAVADIVYNAITLTSGAEPSVSVADVFYILTYPLLVVGFTMLVKRRAGQTILGVVIDAAAVACVAGVLLWEIAVVAPGGLTTGTMIERAVLAGYPVMDILLVAGAAIILLSRARRDGDMMLLVAFVATLFASDTLFALGNTTVMPDWVWTTAEGGFYVSYGLIAAAGALQPHRAASAIRPPSAPNSTVRVVLLAVALCTAPLFALGSAIFGYEIHVVSFVCFSILLSLVGVARMVGLVHRLEVEQDRLERAKGDMEFQATHDALTGLPNRAALLGRLKAEVAIADRRHLTFAVLHLDIDEFTLLNDSFGHQAGDRLLKTVASRLRTVLRAGDFVARVGGDEYVIVAPGTRDERDADALAERIHAEIGRPLDIDGNVIHPTGSIGVAFFDPDGTDQDLLGDTDLALYEAKHIGGMCTAIFHPRLRASVDERTSIATGLRNALGHRDFEIVYQPLVALETGRLTGVEALLRWPSRPDIPVSRFIEIAERSGFIETLGRFVLQTACNDLAVLSAASGEHDLSVAVNVSARQIQRGGLANDISVALLRSGIDPSRLTIEQTETGLAEDAVHVVPALEAIRRMGVRVEIDDFGTGYSSLSRLSSLPLDGVKIDRTFVAALTADPRGEAVFAAITDLARAVDLSVTAEGIETAEQSEIVQRLGGQTGQGYLFGHPVPRAEIERMLEERRPLVHQ